MGGMWISGLLVIAAIVFAIWWVASPGHRRAPATQDPAEEALRLRYARGEMDRDEYERRMHDLRR